MLKDSMLKATDASSTLYRSGLSPDSPSLGLLLVLNAPIAVLGAGLPNCTVSQGPGVEYKFQKLEANLIL